MKLAVRIFIPFIITCVQCTIDGISYLDELKAKDWFNIFPKRDNPCNPLYWYPKKIPDYCYAPKFPNSPNVRMKPKPTPATPPMPPMPPIPAPPGNIAPVIPPPIIPSSVIPSPLFPAPAFPQPMMPSPIISSPMIPPPLAPAPMIPSPPIPSLTYSAPLVAPNPMVPAIPQYPYTGYQNLQLPLTYGQQTAGMVPGLPGIVSRDGGINILPFSDAYSDLLEKHKQKVIRRKLEKVIKQYEDYPRPKHFYRRKRLKKIFFDTE